MTTPAPQPARRRDAAGTRQLLLDAARRRFAYDGYAATTVRDIADEAGVNVALINRYFSSKEGLFRASLTGAVDELGRSVDEDVTLDQVPYAIARQLTGDTSDMPPSRLLLLLRTSGDERAEQIRLDTLRTFAERLAATASWRPEDAEADRLILRAQVALAAAFGIALLRSSTALEPLGSAGEQDLVGPLRDLFHGLLAPARPA
ncbi:TetR/AcrR family transcriptional regulator [Micromonospora sp. NPDC050397]|uniref:TetR/AcrR family transcriptional regulator n=1 Tax=Micromonospora sp. NPDC050397 TaxID=3364279 RepID=UPI00384C7008